MSAFLAFQTAADSRLWKLVALEPPPGIPAHLAVDAQPFTVSEVVRAAALKHGVPKALVYGVIQAESGFKADAVSNKGAVGLMQLMPETAQELGADPSVPEQNIQAGTQYLGWLVNRYKSKRDPLRFAIAAYNAGPGNVDRYRGVPPFRETRRYVNKVLANYRSFRNRDTGEGWTQSD